MSNPMNEPISEQAKKYADKFMPNSYRKMWAFDDFTTGYTACQSDTSSLLADKDKEIEKLREENGRLKGQNEKLKAGLRGIKALTSQDGCLTGHLYDISVEALKSRINT